MCGKPTKVVIAGGGVAALEAALALRALAEDRISVELIAPELHFWYRPSPSPSRSGWARRAGSSCPSLRPQPGPRSRPERSPPSTSAHQLRTTAGAVMPYDVLLVACGAVPVPALPGAATFRGPADVEMVRSLLDELEAGAVRSVAFTVPWGVVWSLPAYELALMTAAHVAARELADVSIALATPSRSRCSCSGRRPSRRFALLEERAWRCTRGCTRPTSGRDGSRLCREAGSTPSAWSRCRVCAVPGSRDCRRRGPLRSR